MKHLKKLLAWALALCLVLSCVPMAQAATADDAVIDPDAECSLTLYKYDISAAEADGFEPGSMVSAGLASSAQTTLAPYAIQGVEFTHLRVADFITYSYQEAGGYKVMPLYRFAPGDATQALLSALGLSKANAYREVQGYLDFVPDVIQTALSHQLTDNATVLKNALEALALEHGTAMPETNADGCAAAFGLPVGLYLLAETKVPENVVCTTDPFLVSLPMTTADGSAWIYDITLHPKNRTGSPTLEKTVREAQKDTGKNNGSSVIDDGFRHTATGSVGDVMEYQILSTLPSITSDATALTQYTFRDNLSAGLTYTKGDVVLSWYRDGACTDLITVWKESEGKFTVSYTENTMEVSMNEAGLAEINSGVGAHSAASTQRGYSGCTLRITYTCTLTSDAVLGDAGNPNTVTLTWKRTNTDYYDTLTDDAHAYTYGLNLTKQFSNGLGNPGNVEFVIHNDTDDYYVVGTLNTDEEIYYVTSHTANKDAATRFVPVQEDEAPGVVYVRGLEDDAYSITEVHTDAGFVLLEKPIQVEISTQGNGELCPICGMEGITAEAAVNGTPVKMGVDHESVNAFAALAVTNMPVDTIPNTGDHGMIWVLAASCLASLCGIILTAACLRRKRGAQ